ncbi:MAG: SRPBCC family protein, partial [Actinomycetota bacterium]|nr:SRPBCC family protein [Actinomycetota bacterium]
MLQYLARITSDMGRDEAFSDLSHFDRAAEWDPGVAEGTMLTPEPVGRGSRFGLLCRFLGRSVPMEYEIVEFEPSARIVLRAETPFVRSIDTITFESASGTFESASGTF